MVFVGTAVYPDQQSADRTRSAVAGRAWQQFRGQRGKAVFALLPATH
jgi:hypothetical protein